LSRGNLEGVVVDDYSLLSKWIFQVATALTHMHKMGVVHRDVKTDNIAIDGMGNAKLIDFGSAILIEELEEDGFRMGGSPGYTPPEIIRRKYLL
jgi:serine/threonine protein kinase